MLKIILKTKKFNYLVNLALLAIRIITSIMMLTHGFPKLVKLLSWDIGFPDPLGLGVESTFVIAVFAEFFCSVLLIIGLASRIATFHLIATMLVALLVVHSGESVSDHYNILLYLLSYVLILILGPGKYSLDYMITKKLFDE